MAAYNDFLIKKIGLPAKNSKQENDSMCDILRYFDNFESKPGIKLSDAQIIQAWKNILDKWDTLDNYLIGKISISQISYNITSIILKQKNIAQSAKLYTYQQVCDLCTQYNSALSDYKRVLVNGKPSKLRAHISDIQKYKLQTIPDNQ
jgi:hypothetical protein